MSCSRETARDGASRHTQYGRRRLSAAAARRGGVSPPMRAAHLLALAAACGGAAVAQTGDWSRLTDEQLTLVAGYL